MVSRALKAQIVTDLRNTHRHLDYSYRKVLGLSLERDLGEEELESLESFSSRFARYSDMIVARYFRALMLDRDPAFRGSVIDLLNSAEKLGWIDSANTWRRIRELRNVAAHQYTDDDFLALYRELRDLASVLLAVSLEL
ncbi:MAG: hypothetical protein AAB426_08050 [Myxococcota bacterium]